MSLHDITKKLRMYTRHPTMGGSTTIPQPVIDEAADEIERLRADLALLGPVTTPLSGELCASCVEPMVQHWTYCPYCGAQGRLGATGEKLS